MKLTYLFRLDGARDNDEFLQLSLSQGINLVYAGVEMKIGRGWVPDFLEVSGDFENRTCVVRLIELEATEISALVSTRKYLPEDSSRILKAFDLYLDRVVDRCRTTSDPRRDDFVRLKNLLLEAKSISVRTAGALRTSRQFIEDLLLMDQPQSEQITRIQKHSTPQSFTFFGERSLSPRDRKSLFRTLLILDGVIRERDHSAARVGGWLAHRTQPLKIAVKDASNRYPLLAAFLSADKRSGGRTNCDGLAKELSALWSKARKVPLDPHLVSDMVVRYFPTARLLREHDPIQKAFESARAVIEDAVPHE